MDWIAAVFELSGLWVVGNKKCIGFALNMCCDVAWIAYVFRTRAAWGLLLVVVPALFINVRNFMKWRV